MADEIKEELQEEKKSNYDKKELKRFLLTILGSFLGCLVALCLYNAALKPQPPVAPPCPCSIQKMHHHKNFQKPQRPDIKRIEHRRPQTNFKHRSDAPKFDKKPNVPVKPET